MTTGSVDATVYDQYGEDMLMWDYVSNGYYGGFFTVTNSQPATTVTKIIPCIEFIRFVAQNR